ncbi:MAG: BLUF domain-containing protein [Alphaproteobacteria bacterium]
MPLTRLVYHSRCALSDNAQQRLEELRSMLATANEKNSERNITGALAFDDMHFIQVLEGERNDVWDIFQHIMRDNRHTEVRLVQFVEVPERLFSNWWMALARRTPETASLFDRLTGVNGQLNMDELTSMEMMHLMIKLAETGFDRELMPAGKVAVAKAG